MIIDGKAIARVILEGTKKRAEALGREPIVRAIVMQPTAATESYLRIKTEKAREAGMYLELVRMENDATTEDILAKIALPGADALIVQLPLPQHIDTKRVLDAIPHELDADVLSSATYDRFLHGEVDVLVPPVAGAVAEILTHAGVEVAGTRAVVVGNGRLVGQPVRSWLMRNHAEVLVLTEDTFEERKNALKKADIVVTGAGKPRLITPDMLATGAVLIDAGTSESGGAIVGDFDPACAKNASVFTPVPGGVGPIAVAYLFKNAAELMTRDV